MNIKALSEAAEKVSLIYASKFHIKRDKNWFILKLQEEMGELTQSFLMLNGQGRSKGKSEQELKEAFAREIADVFCHLLLLAKNNNVDIEKEIDEKWFVWAKNVK